MCLELGMLAALIECVSQRKLIASKYNAQEHFFGDLLGLCDVCLN